MEAVTTTVDPLAEIAALAAQYEGGYEGTWHNTTFGSEGPIIGNLVFDVATLTVTLDVDLGGLVFGTSDPDRETIVVSLADVALGADGTVTITSATLGDLVVSVTEEGIELFGAEVPDPGIATVLVTGPMTTDGFELAYVIGFTGGGGAEGTATIRKTG